MSSKWPKNAKNGPETPENPSKTYNNAYHATKTDEVGFRHFQDSGPHLWLGRPQNGQNGQMSSKWPKNAKNGPKTPENPSKTYNNAYHTTKTDEVGFWHFYPQWAKTVTLWDAQWPPKYPKSQMDPHTPSEVVIWGCDQKEAAQSAHKRPRELKTHFVDQKSRKE